MSSSRGKNTKFTNPKKPREESTSTSGAPSTKTLEQAGKSGSASRGKLSRPVPTSSSTATRVSAQPGKSGKLPPPTTRPQKISPTKIPVIQEPDSSESLGKDRSTSFTNKYSRVSPKTASSLNGKSSSLPVLSNKSPQEQIARVPLSPALVKKSARSEAGVASPKRSLASGSKAKPGRSPLAKAAAAVSSTTSARKTSTASGNAFARASETAAAAAFHAGVRTLKSGNRAAAGLVAAAPPAKGLRMPAEPSADRPPSGKGKDSAVAATPPEPDDGVAAAPPPPPPPSSPTPADSTGPGSTPAPDSSSVSEEKVLKKKDVLQPLEWKLYADFNSKKHHTSTYGLIYVNPRTPVLRRGLTFTFAITFNREYDSEKDNVYFIMQFEKTKCSEDIFHVMRAENEKLREEGKWSAVALSKKTYDVRVTVFQVFIPATAHVGQWTLTARTGRTTTDETEDFTCLLPMYVLFNPWCKEDPVFLEEEARQEYVLKESGRLFRGVSTSVTSRPWVFGQFEVPVLPCVFLLLRSSNLSLSERSSPSRVVGSLTRMINKQRGDPHKDHDPCENFDCQQSVMLTYVNGSIDGTHPLAWTGSAQIMDQYLQTGKSVKYGENWIYSGLLVTACRALGIPCRSLTLYESAHNAENNFTLEVYIERDKLLYTTGRPRLYRVFNEAWMTRKDIQVHGKDFSGWQILDPTPQLRNVGRYQCGPAPVKAVTEGVLSLGDEIKFIFSESNADILYFSEGGKEMFLQDTSSIGCLAVTEKVRNGDRPGMQDVTKDYKLLSDTGAERQGKMNELRQKLDNPMSIQYSTKSTGLEFDLEAPASVDLGTDVEVLLHVTNNASVRNVASYLAVTSTFQTGITFKIIDEKRENSLLEEGERKTVHLNIPVKKYVSRLTSEGVLKIVAIVHARPNDAGVKDFVPVWIEEKKIRLVPPTIDVTLHGGKFVKEESLAFFTLRNPLKVSLTRCEYAVEGAHLIKHKRRLLGRDVPPHETVQFAEVFYPSSAGNHDLVVTFLSRELICGAEGCLTLTVRKPPSALELSRSLASARISSTDQFSQHSII